MKNIKWFTGACLLAGGLTFLSACSDDNGAVAPVFPENIETISLETAGEKAQFTFSANTDWTLTSSKLWCKFVSEGEALPMMLGAAGEHTVEILVTDDIWDFADATAEVSLNMGGQSKVIAKVTRGAKELSITGYDAEHPFVIEYVKSQDGVVAVMKVNANFDWVLSESPEWLVVEDLPIQGHANREQEVKVIIADDAKVAAQNGELTFKQLEAEGRYVIPVNYQGMGNLDFESSLTNVWNWEVSKEGDTYWSGSLTGDNEAEKESFPMSIKVATKDYDYEVVRLFMGEAGLMEPDEWNGGNFFKVEDDGKGNLSIPAFEANTKKEREGYVMVFPRYVYQEQLQENVENAIDQETWTSIKEEYEKYIAWNFVQESAQEALSGFEVLQGGITKLECLPGDNGTGYAEMVSGATGIPQDQIFFVKTTAQAYLQVNPMLSPEQWDPTVTETNGMMIMSMEGDDYTNEWTPNMSGESYVMEGSVPKTMFISFPDNSQGYPLPCKALIIIVE